MASPVSNNKTRVRKLTFELHTHTHHSSHMMGSGVFMCSHAAMAGVPEFSSSTSSRFEHELVGTEYY